MTIVINLRSISVEKMAIFVLMALGLDFHKAVMIVCWGQNPDYERSQIIGHSYAWEQAILDIRNLLFGDFEEEELKRLTQIFLDIEKNPMLYCPAACAPCK